MESFIEKKEQIVQKFLKFSKLVVEIIGEDKKDILNLFIKIRMISLKQSTKHRKKVTMILEECLHDLKQLDIK